MIKKKMKEKKAYSLHKEPIDFFSLSPAFILSEFVMNERVPLYL